MFPLLLAITLSTIPPNAHGQTEDSSSLSSLDRTEAIDIYRTVGGTTYTNLSDDVLRCQISTRIDPSLPIGTLAEKRNILLRGSMSYVHQRKGEQIIYCVLDDQLLRPGPNAVREPNTP